MDSLRCKPDFHFICAGCLGCCPSRCSCGARRSPLYELSAFLAGPAAAVTLLFPAVIESSRPVLMRLAFLQLHVLVALTP